MSRLKAIHWNPLVCAEETFDKLLFSRRNGESHMHRFDSCTRTAPGSSYDNVVAGVLHSGASASSQLNCCRSTSNCQSSKSSDDSFKREPDSDRFDEVAIIVLHDLERVRLRPSNSRLQQLATSPVGRSQRRTISHSSRTAARQCDRISYRDSGNRMRAGPEMLKPRNSHLLLLLLE